MTRPDSDEYDPRIGQAIREMQQEVPVRAEWREALDRELLQLAPSGPAPLTRRRHWQISRPMAIAAALGFMMVGAVLRDATHLFGPDRSHSAEPVARDVASRTTSPASTIGVRFSVMAPGVQRVSLVGDFNGWNADATPLEVAADGQTWTTMLPLPAGRHAYAFVIDGQVVRDPAAPAEAEEDFGVPNSLVLVSNNR